MVPRQALDMSQTQADIKDHLGWLQDNFAETALEGESTDMNITARYIS